MSNVVVFGSLNMDLSIASDHMPVLGETVIGRDFITNPGGKGANQAVAAAKLGADVTMLGAVGTDAFGDQMIAALAEYGVQCDHLLRTAEASTSVALITRVNGDNFITIDSGANMVPRIDCVRRSIDALARGGDVFLCQLECDFDTTMEALRYAHERGMYTVVNPAPARELPLDVYPFIDLLVVNECECETLTSIFPDDERAIRAAMEELASAGTGAMAITLGARGSMVYDQGAIIESVPSAVHAVDTTCAGDTYIGALVAGYARGLTMEEAVAIATKASALATTKVGAQQSIPLLADVE
ncbi:MAG: ribokinase [Eggerthellaceae bacterium]|nr:ribokinase [Eggerthellaceae bacterium]